MMTPDQRLAECAAMNQNSRWVRCKEALGRDPEGWEFLLWNNARLREFWDKSNRMLWDWIDSKPHYVYVEGRLGGEDMHRLYDLWMFTEPMPEHWKKAP